MAQPILRTDRMLLVPLAERHFELEVQLDSDAEVLRYLVGMRHVRTFFPVWDEPLPGADQGEVEYEITREMWQAGVGTLGQAGARPSG